jgi:hypothetical protein
MEHHMKPKLNPFTDITLLDPDFVQAINTILECALIDTTDGVILTFIPNKPPAGHNNLSPMELAIDHAGNMQYLFVYSKSVSPRVVETHWNFIDGTYTNLTEISDLVVGRSLLQLITRNLSGQINASLYQIDIAPLFNRPQTAQSP